MAIEITKGVVDKLELISVLVKKPEVLGAYELVFTMSGADGELIVYGCVSYMPSGSVVSRSYSDCQISDLAKKKLRRLMRSITMDIVSNLR